MKDEIKEILNNWKYVINNRITVYGETIGFKQIELLLDYITNLQQIEQDHQKLNGELREENKKLQEKLNLAENILYDYLYNDGKITKEKYEQFKGLKEYEK